MHIRDFAESWPFDIREGYKSVGNQHDCQRLRIYKDGVFIGRCVAADPEAHAVIALGDAEDLQFKPCVAHAPGECWPSIGPAGHCIPYRIVIDPLFTFTFVP